MCSSWARSSKQVGADTYGQSRGQGGFAFMWNSRLGGISPLNDIKHDNATKKLPKASYRPHIKFEQPTKKGNIRYYREEVGVCRRT